MKIIDLSRPHDFSRACRAFRDELDRRFGRPDLVVGIATGGLRTVESMGYSPAKVIAVKRQRASTRLKSYSRIGAVFRSMPIFISDMARMVEAFLREQRFILSGKRLEQRPVKVIDGAAWLDLQPNSILIIDDAVDSGATFVDVVGFLKDAFPDAMFVTAAICQTFRNPAYKVDYIMYKRTLLRCPWAMDAKYRSCFGKGR
ncbi:hypothetical protein [Castellaniella sp.]|uniref:hypothetical protein n=1 Tax=Castellaniella sp. TaxID=1955812 RepID=UPI003C7415A9